MYFFGVFVRVSNFLSAPRTRPHKTRRKMLNDPSEATPCPEAEARSSALTHAIPQIRHTLDEWHLTVLIGAHSGTTPKVHIGIRSERLMLLHL